MNKPLVSIIIPVYNGSNFLAESIDSALTQSYENIEVIVVNDGSNDNGKTEQIAKKYGEKIRYFSKENGGVSTALNLGIKQMSGEWFSWLSHDDLYHEDKIKDQIRMTRNFEHKNVVICNSELIDKKGKYIKKNRKFKKNSYTGKEMFQKLFLGNSINGCSLLIPREALTNGGYFDEKLKYIQDFKMWINIALQDYSFVIINKSLLQMRIHSDQQTLNLKSILPQESESFILELLNNESVNSDENKTIVIFIYCMKTNKKNIIKKYNDSFFNFNTFTFQNKVRYVVYLLVGKLIFITKTLYRQYMTARWRDTK